MNHRTVGAFLTFLLARLFWLAPGLPIAKTPPALLCPSINPSGKFIIGGPQGQVLRVHVRVGHMNFADKGQGYCRGSLGHRHKRTHPYSGCIIRVDMPCRNSRANGLAHEHR